MSSKPKTMQLYQFHVISLPLDSPFNFYRQVIQGEYE